MIDNEIRILENISRLGVHDILIERIEEFKKAGFDPSLHGVEIRYVDKELVDIYIVDLDSRRIVRDDDQTASKTPLKNLT